MRDYQNYNGRLKNINDQIIPVYGQDQQTVIAVRGTGLALPNAFLTVDAFQLYANRLFVSFGCWVDTASFDAGGNPIDIFSKRYFLGEGEMSGFQSANSTALAGFLALARTLCGASANAEFVLAEISPTNWSIHLQFKEPNGQIPTFRSVGDAYLSAVNDSQFEPFRTALAEISFGIASSKESDFWTNTILAE